MKKFLALLLLCLSLPMLAQQTVVITGADGTEQLRMPVWKLGNIKFLPFEKPQTRMGTAIDLGLKSQVQWSNINIGAEDSLGVGYLFGWGNPDYTNWSEDLKFFPATIAGTNIVSTTNDIAQYYWGGEWRMPTVQDFEELLTLDWEWQPNDRAFRVSNPDNPEKFIVLPLTGFAFGEQQEIETDSAYYWTGEIAHNDSASYLRFGESEKPEQLLEAFRARRFAVRPVFGEYRTPVSIVADEAVVASKSATVRVTISGMADEVEFGVVYSTQPSVTRGAGMEKAVIISDLTSDRTEMFVIDGLDYETTYYYRAFAQVGNDLIIEDTDHWFTTDADRRLVDLGLSVKWARWDVGADAEYEYGDAYAWGCTDLKTFVTNATQNNISGTQYDVAHTHADWGDEWRMPTKEEWEELFSLCQAEGSYVRTPSGNYIFGVKFTRLDAWRDGQQLDDYLFIPYCGFDQIHEYRGGTGFYWAATSVDGTNAYQVKLETGVGEILANGKKVTPRNVRAVYGERDMTQIIQDGNGGGNNGGNNNGGGNNGGGNEGGGNEGGGDDPGTVLPDLDEDTFGAVDLGLTSGTLWANMNMGATHTYETGNYYAWGETEPKEQYTTETYQYYVNNRYVASTYRELSGHQDCDPCTQIEGGNWVMPTREQYEELIAQCTWTWLPGEEKYNNMPGFLVTSKKYPSKSIFFPAANRKFKRQPAYGIGYYWTATYNGADDERTSAYAVIMDPNNSVPAAIGNERRYYGMPIRPVQNKK